MEDAPAHKSPQTADKQNSSFHFSSLNQVCNEDLLSAIAGGAAYGRNRSHNGTPTCSHRLTLPKLLIFALLKTSPKRPSYAVWLQAIVYAPQAGAVRSRLLSILRHRTFDELHVLHRRSNLQEVTWAQVEKEAQPILPDARNEAWRPLLSSQLRNSAHADSTGTARRDRAGVCSGMDSPSPG
jgi:hypothetical protein